MIVVVSRLGKYGSVAVERSRAVACLQGFATVGDGLSTWRVDGRVGSSGSDQVVNRETERERGGGEGERATWSNLA